ncbi:MAG: MATE family efflux transporter [Piscirickettsiaceae bacterium]|nr:MATE family efflux transporter [Piscirickettsiaceae bacterium]
MDLIKDPIKQLIKRIAVPASVGMFFNTMYYIVDNFYAGMLSSTALAGISLAAPIYFMGLAISIGVGQGTNALVGHARGAGNQKEAEKIAGHALSFAWVMSLIIGLLVLIAAPNIFSLMKAEGAYTDEAMKYLYIILPSLGLLSHGMAANGILNSLGDTTSLRNSLIVAFLANIILDPLFMFGLGWGVYGLAAASAVTQLGSAVYLTIKIRQSKLGNSLALHNLIPNWIHYQALLKQSLPASGNMFLIALGSLIITSAVARFGENAVAGLGIALRIEQLVLLPTIGLNIAVLSLVSVNFGANQFHRMEQAAIDSIKIGTSMMVIGGILIFTFAYPLISLFAENKAVIEIGVSYLRVEAIILPAYVLSFVASAVLQGVKQPMIPMYFNIVRTLLLPITFIFIALSLIGTGIYGVWVSIAIATWLTASVQFMHMRKLVKLKNKLG